MSLAGAIGGDKHVEANCADPDRDLIERAKHDRHAFAQLYRRHYRLVADYIYRRTGDSHLTEDLVSEVFMIALRSLPRFRYRGIPLRFWLLRIATNEVNRWSRRNRSWLFGFLDAEQVDNQQRSTPVDDGEYDLEAAQRALLSLSPKHQAVLALHHLEGMPIKQVAIVLGCRVGTVKSRLARARDLMRAKLEPQENRHV